MRIAVIFSKSINNATLSYQHGWVKAFAGSRMFDCTFINLAEVGFLDSLAAAQNLVAGRFNAIILLHSAFANSQNLRGTLFWAVAACKAPKAFFIGNEYKLMPEKIKFCKMLGISLLITQSNDERVASLYRSVLNCEVDCIPNTGVDPSIFHPIRPMESRPVDLGYRSFPGPWYLGNNEKTEVAEHFTRFGELYGLKTDISLKPEDRLDASGYAMFLNKCRGQIGGEAGGDYFELTDRTRKLVNAYLKKRPSATWLEIKTLFFNNYGQSIPMRIISGRHVEAAACKTVQILLEGRYNGYFKADVHYISLAKDYSNGSEVIAKFRDLEFCKKIAENAYEVVMSDLTYDRLLETFIKSLKKVL